MLEHNTLQKINFHEFESLPDSYLFLTPDLIIIDATNEYLKSTLSKRERIVGKNIFEAFPSNPALKNDDGVSNLRNSLEYVLKNKKPHEMSVQRYDVPLESGGFEKKYWKSLNTPVLNSEGNVNYLIYKVIDITAEMECKSEINTLSYYNEKLSQEIQDVQKTLKEQLREMEQLQEANWFNDRRFKLLLENFPQITWTSHSNGNVDFFNKKWFEYTGLTYEESINWGFHEVIHPDDLKLTIDAFVYSVENKTSYEIEIRMKRASDQTYRWFLVQCHPVRDNHNEIVHWIGTSTDIHDLKMAEAGLRDIQRRENELHEESEEQRLKLHNLFMQVPALICIFKGPEHRIEMVNPAYYKLFPNRPVLGKKVKEVLYEYESQQILELLDEVYRTGKEYIGNETPMQLVKEEGGPVEVIYFNFIYKATYDLNHQVDGVFSFSYEVTDLVKAKKVLEGYNERTKLILESLPMISWTSDSEGVVDYFNDTWHQYTGISRDNMEPWIQLKVVHPDDLPYAMQAWKEASPTGSPVEVNYRLRRGSDGMYRWHLGRTIPIRNAQGQITKWVGTATDIHEQKTANDVLTSKNKELERINNDLDNFIYTASHDLKAPISNLEGLINAISYEEDSEEQKQLLTMMYRSVERLKNTIRDLTEITYAQKREYEDVALVDVEVLTKEVMVDLKDLIQNNEAIIHTNFQSREVKFSKKNLRSIISNLLSNAIKYRSFERQPVITIQTIKEEKYFNLHVSDNGLGMSSHTKDKIFGMFKRMHDHVEGTGIGLYIVKRIVENAGGKIEVESELGKGSTFKVSLRYT